MLESELFAFLGNTAEAAFAIGETGKICFWNHAAEALFGYPASMAIGKTCCALLHGVDSLGTQICMNRASVMNLSSDRASLPAFDLNVTTSGGEHLWISLSTLVHRNERTNTALTVHLAHDVSARKRKEELLERMTAIFRDMNETSDRTIAPAPVNTLSSRELEVLRLFALGIGSSEVADKLKITPQTLRNHLHHINGKLRTHNRLEAVTHAMQRKLI